MIFIAIACVAVIFGLFLLFRWTGRMGTRPAPQERMRHSESERQGPGPRASGLN
jgi:hypothetical protein